jgi:SAM-dependent methyltransferase
VLDVGAGTGVAAAAAAAAVGHEGFVVATDPSVALLARASEPLRFVRAAAAAPGLPFAAESFDAVVGNVVLSHLADYAEALAELADGLRPGGRLGVTTWGRLGDWPAVDDHAERAAYGVWEHAAAEFVDVDRLDEDAAAGTPWEGWFSDPANLRAALGAARLNRVELTGRAYRYRLSHDDWLTGAQTSARGRVLRRLLTDEQLAAFTKEVHARLRERSVPDPVPCVDEALIAVGTRAGGRAARSRR